MKFNAQTLILSLLFARIALADGQDTNDVFLPDVAIYDPMIHGSSARFNELNERAKEAAIKAGECRPAELDPDGHWGQVTVGFQMSIRSATNVFIVGTNIPVTVILRNTTTNTLSRLCIPRLPLDGGEALFEIEDEAGQIRQSAIAGTSGASFISIGAKRQVKHEHDLNYEFHLPKGIFKVRAHQLVQGSDPGNQIPMMTNIYSGTLTIKVVPP